MYPDIDALIGQTTCGQAMSSSCGTHIVTTCGLNVTPDMVIQHFASSRLKRNCVLLSARHDVNHYTIVAAQLGLMANRYQSSTAVDGEGCRVVQLTPENAESVEELVKYITKTISTFKDQSLPLCMIIDDIAALLDVGWPIDDVIGLVNQIHSMTTTTDNSLMITCMDMPVEEDEETDYAALFVFVTASANVAIALTPIGSSYAKDVTGKFTVISDDANSARKRQSSLLYLVSERSIKFMQPGQLQFAL